MVFATYNGSDHVFTYESATLDSKGKVVSTYRRTLLRGIPEQVNVVDAKRLKRVDAISITKADPRKKATQPEPEPEPEPEKPAVKKKG